MKELYICLVFGCRWFPTKGKGVGPGGSVPSSFLYRQTDIKTSIVRQASKAAGSSPEASMVALGVTVSW